jgi:glycosyltransferase involved in cell wall biosynthesis
VKFVQWNSATWWGGAEVRTVELCEELRRRGYEVRVVARCPSRLWRTLKERGFLVDGDAPRQGANLLRAILIGLRLRQWGTDLLIAHIGRDYVPALFAGKVAGCSVVLYRHRSLPLKPITRWLVRRWARAILAVSTKVAEILLHEDGLPSEKVHVVHLGVDVRKLTGKIASAEKIQRLRMDLGAERSQLVLSVGHLYPKKGHATLLLALHRLRRQGEKIVAAIAGEGPDQARLERLIRDLGLQGQVHLLGYREDIPLLLQACDCFVLLSEEDAFPGAIIEAMVVGKPIIACGVGGVPELLADYPLAKLVPPRDEEAAARAILEMLTRKDCPIVPFRGWDIAETVNRLETLCRQWFSLGR